MSVEEFNSTDIYLIMYWAWSMY